MKLIKLSLPPHYTNKEDLEPYFAIVDNNVFEFINQWKWRLFYGYAVRARVYRKDNGWDTGSQIIGMHAQILFPRAGMVPHHINGNKLDNRLANLELVSLKLNNQLRNAGFLKHRYAIYPPLKNVKVYYVVPVPNPVT
jgi:hypothetical protein